MKRNELREEDMAVSFPDMLKILESPEPKELFYPMNGGNGGVSRYEIL